MVTEKYIAYRGKGEHSVNELEKIIEQREEELHVIKSHPTTLPSDEEIEASAEKYGFRVPYDGSDKFYDDEAIKHFEEGMKQMRYLCEAKIAEMEREMKRLRFMIDNGLGAKDIQNDI